jgi:hypothetical protein
MPPSSFALLVIDHEDRGGEGLRLPWRIDKETTIRGGERGVWTAYSPGTRRGWRRGLGWLDGDEIDKGVLRVRRRLELDSGC